MVEEKVNNIRSKLEHRIEEVENEVAQHSQELKCQKDRIEEVENKVKSNTKEIECLAKKVKTEDQYEQKEKNSESFKKKGINFLMKKIKYTKIDFTDYSLLPNSLVSMVAHFCITGKDENYIPIFLKRICFWLISGSITKLYFGSS